jgi:FSR family fosmidomycin resistance protein-like MFS transporter
MATDERNFIRDKSYLSVSVSHFFVDVLNSGRVLLVALIAVGLGMSNAQVGLFLLLYNLGGSLSQPLFGLLADRAGARWPVVGGVAWMILFYALAAIAPPWPALIALTIASLGSGAVHPSGAKVASQSSDRRRTQATAIFFMAGQLGLFAGPVLAGGLLQLYDRPGYLGLPLIALVALLGSWRWLSDDVTTHTEHAPVVRRTPAASPGRRALMWRMVPAVIIIILSYNTLSNAIQNFTPKLFTEWNYAPTYVGWITGLYMAGSAIGGLVGGTLADRYGGKPVITVAMLAVVVPVYLYIPAGDVARFPLLLLAGFFGGMPHSILVLAVQSFLPGRRALASGLALGFMFTSASLGSFVVGVIADQVGLDTALQGLALLPLAAAAVSLLLPRRPGAMAMG